MSEVKTPANDLYFVFSVQEEVGCRGAKAAAWHIDPDFGIALDVTRTGDAPSDAENTRMAVRVGAGPTVKVKDSSLLCNPQVIAHLRAAAKKARIPYQDEVLPAGGTDSAAMQRTREGILSGCVSIPTRNIHTPGEIVSIKDVQQAGKLIAAACELGF
jgi:endoglucanase